MIKYVEGRQDRETVHEELDLPAVRMNIAVNFLAVDYRVHHPVKQNMFLITIHEVQLHLPQ
eukprot:564794-Ditylum_brightwellii.AAC.1